MKILQSPLFAMANSQFSHLQYCIDDGATRPADPCACVRSIISQRCRLPATATSCLISTAPSMELFTAHVCNSIPCGYSWHICMTLQRKISIHEVTGWQNHWNCTAMGGSCWCKIGDPSLSLIKPVRSAVKIQVDFSFIMSQIFTSTETVFVDAP